MKRLQLRSVCGALLVLLTGAHCCGTEAKTPGSIHCYNAICHRVRTLSETAALVGRPLRLRASFYDHCSRDRHNTCGLTSSGEVFAATAADNAASPDLPDGTIVLIFNPATGQAAIARINNAGPYSPGRNLDVSRTLAGALGFERQGLAELDVIVLQAPAHADARYRHQRQYRTVAGFLGTFAARDEAIARANLALQHQDQPAPTSGATASAVDAIIAGLPLLVLAGAAPRVDADANAVALLAAGNRTELSSDFLVPLMDSMLVVNLAEVPIALAALADELEQKLVASAEPPEDQSRAALIPATLAPAPEPVSEPVREPVREPDPRFIAPPVLALRLALLDRSNQQPRQQSQMPPARSDGWLQSIIDLARPRLDL